MSERTADDVIGSNACNTYVMSCHLNSDDLYKAMREDIKIMCNQYSTLKTQRDELLAAAKRVVFYGPTLDDGMIALRAAIANAEKE